MAAKEQITEILTKRYQAKDMESWLNRRQFQTLFRDAVKDYYPKLTKQYEGQSIYGISFEIGNVVQKVYFNHFESYIYLNTEEMYLEKIEHEKEEEDLYYRFGAWAEWDVICAESALFGKVQDYLEQNSLYACTDPLDDLGLSEEAAAWYQEQEAEFEDAFEEECGQIRLWMAEALGELRKSGFWEEQGNAGIYVIPFEGECEIGTEELEETFQIMDLGCHGTEYLDYLAYCDS